MELNEKMADILSEMSTNRKVIEHEGFHPVMVNNNDINISSLEKHAKNPYLVEAMRSFENADGFIKYVNEFKQAGTVLFCNSKANSLTSVIDYHGKDGTPSWCKHKAHLQLELSNDVFNWQNKDGQSMSQQNLVSFLVDYAAMVHDVTYKIGADPVEIDQARFLDMMSRIRSVKNTDIDSKTSTTGGSYELNVAVKTDVTAGDGDGLPEKFSIALPVYKNGESYVFEFRIMVDTSDDGMRFMIKMVRPEAVIENAFNDVVEEIKKTVDKGVSMYGV